MTEGQGHKDQGQRSEKETLAFSRTLLKLQSPNLAQRFLATMRFITYSVTLTEGQGQRSGSKSEKEIWACFAETIEATVTKFGTKVLCDKALHNICSFVTFT